jgi:hypothetical protein
VVTSRFIAETRLKESRIIAINIGVNTFFSMVKIC